MAAQLPPADAVPTVRDDAPAPLERWGNLLGWALFPMLALFVFVNMRNGIHGHPEQVSAELVGLALLSLVTLPFWWLRRDELNRTGRAVLALFGVVLAYALVSSMVTRLPYLQHVHVARSYLVIPLLTATFTVLGAWGLVLAVPARRRRDWLWWGGVTLLVCSLLEWPRMAIAQKSVRLATGMGGAATYHVVLLLCAGVFAGAALQHHRTRASWVACAASVVMLLCTGSRAGLVCLVAALALVVLWAGSRGLGRVVWAVVAGAGVLFAVLLLLVPKLRRMLSFTDQLRQTNLDTALRLYTSGWHTELFGAGYGRLWPWYAFETGRLKILWRGQVTTEFGLAQTNPHSTFLGILVELGALCLLVFVAMCLVLVAHLVRSWRRGDDVWGLLVSVAVACSVLASFFDTYLLKNFGVSLWWWMVVAVMLGTRRAAGDELVGPARLSRSAAPRGR